MLEITENPESYDAFRQAKIALVKMETGKDKTIHVTAENNIRLFLIRGGDVPDTMSYQNIEESGADREHRLSKEDEERIKPYVDKLLEAPERDLTMIVGLNLAMTDIQAPRVSKQYVVRQRVTGIQILNAMPDRRNELRHVIRTLMAHSKNPKEVQRLRDIITLMKL